MDAATRPASAPCPNASVACRARSSSAVCRRTAAAIAWAGSTEASGRAAHVVNVASTLFWHRHRAGTCRCKPLPWGCTSCALVAAEPEPVFQDEEVAPAPAKARPAELRRITEKAAKPAAASVIKTPAPAASERIIDGKQVTAQQRVENEYRRALAQLQDGRVSDAMLALQQTLQLDPRHQGARETLVRLLLEASAPTRRPAVAAEPGIGPETAGASDDAGRLQLDKANGGAAALETLTRSLPYATDNGEYHAFLAGVLQREQRYREASEHYQLALQTAPDNSVWWMGLGIALQADNHPAQARQAFERAKGLQTLSPQLQAFVERKLVQLTAAAAK